MNDNNSQEFEDPKDGEQGNAGLILMGCLAMVVVLICLGSVVGLYVFVSFQNDMRQMQEDRYVEASQQEQRAAEGAPRVEAARRAKAMQRAMLEKTRLVALRQRDLAARKLKESRAAAVKRMQKAAEDAKPAVQQTNAEKSTAEKLREQQQRAAQRQSLMIQVLQLNNKLLTQELDQLSEEDRKELHQRVAAKVGLFAVEQWSKEKMVALKKALVASAQSPKLGTPQRQAIDSCLK
jgi:hypothetical protein